MTPSRIFCGHGPGRVYRLPMFALLVIFVSAGCAEAPEAADIGSEKRSLQVDPGPIDDPDTWAPSTTPCQTGDFPRLMAYRTMSNKNAGQPELNASFYISSSIGPYYEYIHAVDIDELVGIENSNRQACYVSIYHGWWGQMNGLGPEAHYVFPGHWLFAKGTTLAQSAGSGATTLHVADAAVFTTDTYAMIHRQYGPTEAGYGSYSKWDGHDWKSVEYVQM